MALRSLCWKKKDGFWNFRSKPLFEALNVAAFEKFLTECFVFSNRQNILR
jgi:hypothetical protein